MVPEIKLQHINLCHDIKKTKALYMTGMTRIYTRDLYLFYKRVQSTLFKGFSLLWARV